MTQQNRILNYVLNSSEPVKVVSVMDNTKLPRAIVDKWLSVLTKEKICFRVGCGEYFKIKLNDYEIEREKHRRLKKQFPRLYWVYSNAQRRCNNPYHSDYKYYGEKGVKVEITFPELVEIWVRDKGWFLKTPSIDRIDSDGNYTIDNIRFIELGDNARRASIGLRRNKK